MHEFLLFTKMQLRTNVKLVLQLVSFVSRVSESIRLNANHRAFAAL